MLLSLAIRNIILIDHLDIEFASGLCILTGETGAGKSIILTALSIVLGKRITAHVIREGESQGCVTACFSLENNHAARIFLEEKGLENAEELCIRRVLYTQGKQKVFINDTPASLATLNELTSYLVEIHSQHEQKTLFNAYYYRMVLDSYGELEPQVKCLHDIYEQWQALEEESKLYRTKHEQSIQEEHYLHHVHEELSALSLTENEEENLAEKRHVLMQREQTTSAMSHAMDLLQNTILTHTYKIQQSLQKCHHPLLEEINLYLDKATIELTEAVSQIENALGTFEEAENLDKIEERLFSIRTAARKYRMPVVDLLDYQQEVAQKLVLLTNFQEKIDSLQTSIDAMKKNYIHHAALLSQSRKKAASRLMDNLQQELSFLNMKEMRFSIDIHSVEEADANAYGMDTISFLCSTNPGQTLSPLAKIASGGELSRFMLALKVVLAKKQSVSCLIFDEIDTGIGGAEAAAIGERLFSLSQHAQILAVTHQPQVAAKGHQHLKVSKHRVKGKNITSVTILNTEKRMEEIARMLSGTKISDEARAAAGKLLSSG